MRHRTFGQRPDLPDLVGKVVYVVRVDVVHADAEGLFGCGGPFLHGGEGLVRSPGVHVTVEVGAVKMPGVVFLVAQVPLAEVGGAVPGGAQSGPDGFEGCRKGFLFPVRGNGATHVGDNGGFVRIEPGVK